jgi:diaminopimelate epimerase
MNRTVEFYKYVGAGNDFIILEDWDGNIQLSEGQIVSLCDRRFGIGADGIMLLQSHADANFKMNYYNADGSRGEMCGNGARCLVKFAEFRKKIPPRGSFLADDGIHSYAISEDLVDVEIIVNGDLQDWDTPKTGCGFIDTGVPHLIIPVHDAGSEDLDPLGRKMNALPIHPRGTNVNIVEKVSGSVKVRTWERGVNSETLACGTGATAAAIFAHEKWQLGWPVELSFPGGDLVVDYRGNQYWLKGPAQLVFKGHISLSRLHSN